MPISIDGFDINLDITTILIAIGVLIVLWFLFRFVFRLTKVLFRVGCFLLFLIALAAGAYYFLFIN